MKIINNLSGKQKYITVAYNNQDIEKVEIEAVVSNMVSKAADELIKEFYPDIKRQFRKELPKILSRVTSEFEERIYNKLTKI